MKLYTLIFTLLVFNSSLLLGQKSQGYDTSSYNKMEQKARAQVKAMGVSWDDFQKMSADEQSALFAKASKLPPASAPASNIKLGNNSNVPAAVTVTSITPYIESAPTMPSSYEVYLTERENNASGIYLDRIKKEAAIIQLANDKIAAADQKNKFPMASASENEGTLLKQLIQYQQGKDDNILLLEQKKQQLLKMVQDTSNLLQSKYEKEFESVRKKINANDPKIQEEGTLERETLNSKYEKIVIGKNSIIYSKWVEIYSAYKLWEIKHCAKADAIIKNANYFTNIKGITVRANARSLQTIFAGSAETLMQVFDNVPQLAFNKHLF